MKKIEIDLDVHRLIEMNRLDFNESENDILRRLLKIENISQQQSLKADHFRILKEETLSYKKSLDAEGSVADFFKARLNERLSQSGHKNSSDWHYQGVSLPEGTKLQRWIKRNRIEAEIKNGSIYLNGKYFKSPSAAAMEVNGGVNVNGWHFWEFLDPAGGEWKKLIELRPAVRSRGNHSTNSSDASDT